MTRSELGSILLSRGPLASRIPLLPVEAMTALPDGATAIDPGLRADPWPITFGVVHTDSNHHVNSLVYLRVFEEAALRRFTELADAGVDGAGDGGDAGVDPAREPAALFRGPVGLGRRIDIAYRKPCFAGQSMRVVQQAFAYGGGVGVVAALVPHERGAPESTVLHARPHVYARLWFMA